MVAAARRAAQGRAQRAAHHDRRPGLWRPRHVRRRHPDAGARPHREGRPALHAVQLHRAVLAHARGADHRPQPPRGGLRRDLGAVDGLPGLRLDHRSGERDHRQDPRATTATPRRGSARTTTRRASSTASSGPFDQWPSGMGFQYFYGFMGGETDQWQPYLFQDHIADLSVDRQAGLQPHHRHGGRGDRAHEEPQRRGARPAVLRLLRSRRKPLAAPAEEGVDRQVQGQVRHGLERCASRSSPTRSGSASSRRTRSSRHGRTSCRSGTRSRSCRRSSTRARPRSTPATRPIPTTRSAASSRRSRTWASSTTR